MTVDTPAWVRDAVFYQIFPDRFARSERLDRPGAFEPWDAPPTHHGFKGGDLQGIAQRLPYLEDLGVTALYLTPIFSSASNHRYHTYDYYAVDPLLGGDAALRELLDAAHERRMRVVLDGVFNHTGRGFWPFHHILENGASSPYRDWFHLDLRRLEAGRPLLAYPESLPHGFAWDSANGGWDTTGDAPEVGLPGAESLRRLGYRAWWDLPALPKLNTSNPEVREHLLGAAEHWLRFGIDGWRLDVPTEIEDPAFWHAFRERCRAVNPEAYLVGEIWEEAGEWLAGDRFDAVMNYPLAKAILAYVAGPRMDRAVLGFHHAYRDIQPLDGPAFAGELRRIIDLYDPAVTAVQLNLLGSHDTPRFLTLAGGDRDALRLGTFLQMTLPGAPCVYYGDEIGLEGGPDPANRGAFPWDADRWDADLRGFVRSSIALRRSIPALSHGSLAVLASAGGALAFERRLVGEAVAVAVNAGDRMQVLPIPRAHVAEGAWTLPGWAAPRAIGAGSGGGMILELAGRTGCVLRAGDRAE